MSLELIFDHLVDLLLQEIALFFEKERLFIEICPEGIFGHLEVVLDHQERVLQSIFQYPQLLFHHYQHLFRLGIGSSRLHDPLL